MNNKLERKLSQKLIDMGVTPNLKGYKYLLSALIYAVNNPKGWQITKAIYPSISKEYDVTILNVERAIRHAITKTDISTTNSEFIALLAEEVRLEGE